MQDNCPKLTMSGHCSIFNINYWLASSANNIPSNVRKNLKIRVCHDFLITWNAIVQKINVDRFNWPSISQHHGRVHFECWALWDDHVTCKHAAKTRSSTQTCQKMFNAQICNTYLTSWFGMFKCFLQISMHATRICLVILFCLPCIHDAQNYKTWYEKNEYSEPLWRDQRIIKFYFMISESQTKLPGLLYSLIMTIITKNIKARPLTDWIKVYCNVCTPLRSPDSFDFGDRLDVTLRATCIGWNLKWKWGYTAKELFLLFRRML